MTYSTKLKFNNKSRRKTTHKGKSHSIQSLKQFFLRSTVLLTILVLFILTISILSVLNYLKVISQDLPSPDKPFGEKNYASEIYDRNGKLLYRVFGDENRDYVDISQIPPKVKWAYLAAEDINFFEHAGIDLQAIVRCASQNFQNGDISCGASTITQQLIKQTALSDEQSYERKLKEIILALQIERLYSKEEILQMYFTVVPEGSNIYSAGSAAKFYFGKDDLNDLTLAEIATLAAIPQNPSVLSPTKSANPHLSRELLAQRRLYVLEQMQKYLPYINEQILAETGKTSPPITIKQLTKAKTDKVAYLNPDFNIEAPHFVFYTQEKLLENKYNNGHQFTLTDLETGGYKIWTTLDLAMQKQAEKAVKRGVFEYGGKFGAENGSLVTLNPNTGEVLVFVGSKDYFGQASPKGCTYGVNCKFEPNVNIANTLQSYGSSLKPMIYYKSIMNGLITPESILADIPIQLGKNYRPKNYEGGFSGLHSARWMLVNSRNIPAIYLVDYMGPYNTIDTFKQFGYTTFDNPAGYGPSIAVGGGDIKLIEHAQGYGVLATGGKLTPHQTILKIEDRNGNIVYEHKPKLQQVADPRGVFLVNHMLNGKNGGPGVSWDGRDISGKTGTSENQQETLFITYTPELVTAGWLGNNDNTGMRYGASGHTSARPWVSEYMAQVANPYPKTAFSYPKGIINANGNLSIAGITVPRYLRSSRYGKTFYSMPHPELQKYYAAWIQGRERFAAN